MNMQDHEQILNMIQSHNQRPLQPVSDPYKLTMAQTIRIAALHYALQYDLSGTRDEYISFAKVIEKYINGEDLGDE